MGWMKRVSCVTVWVVLCVIGLLGCGQVAAAEMLVDVDGRLAIGAPVVFEGLSIFPVIDTTSAARPAERFLTLKEGLEAKLIEVSEVSDDGSVPSLLVRNRAEIPLLLMAGDVVKGGKQDRVLVADVLVQPNAIPVEVAVNCVEQGRWSGGASAKFGYAGRTETLLKRTVQQEKSQARTWERVAEVNAKKQEALSQTATAEEAAALAPSTGTYRASLENEAVERRKAEYLTAVRPVLMEGKAVVGLVVGHGDAVTSAEVFYHPSLFQKMREDTLSSVVLDAISAKVKATDKSPTPQAAAVFLKEAMAGRVTEEQATEGARRKEKKAAGSTSFEFLDAKGELIHFNTYAD